MLEFYENGKCPFCEHETVGNAIICPGYNYVLDCEVEGGEYCKSCFEDREPKPEVYWCTECHKGYDFKEKHEISESNMKYKGTQKTLDDHFS